MFNSREWLPCPPGEWHRLASLLRYYKRVALALNFLAVIVTVLAVSLGGWAVASMLPPLSSASQPAPGQTAPCQSQVAPCHADKPPQPPANAQLRPTGESAP